MSIRASTKLGRGAAIKSSRSSAAFYFNLSPTHTKLGPPRSCAHPPGACEQKLPIIPLTPRPLPEQQQTLSKSLARPTASANSFHAIYLRVRKTVCGGSGRGAERRGNRYRPGTYSCDIQTACSLPADSSATVARSSFMISLMATSHWSSLGSDCSQAPTLPPVKQKFVEISLRWIFLFVKTV